MNHREHHPVVSHLIFNISSLHCFCVFQYSEWSFPLYCIFPIQLSAHYSDHVQNMKSYLYSAFLTQLTFSVLDCQSNEELSSRFVNMKISTTALETSSKAPYAFREKYALKIILLKT